MASEEWFFQVMGAEKGPYSAAQIKQLASQGLIKPDTLLRRGATGQWVQADRIRGLFEIAAPPPITEFVPPVEEPGAYYAPPQVEVTHSAAVQKTGKRYPFLRALVSVYRIFGGIVALAWIVPLLLGAQPGPAYLPVIGGCLFTGLVFVGAAELMMVFIDTEYNTRRTYEILEARNE